MFLVRKKQIVYRDEDLYISFPDIIRSIYDHNKYFLVFREGDGHHPRESRLILMVSHNEGKDWEKVINFPMSIEKNKAVWNCPRLWYSPEGNLSIICDAKTGVWEPTASFRTYIIQTRKEEDMSRPNIMKTEIPGMVPDHVIAFKDKLFCANHKIKSTGDGRDLVQFMSWSRDGGKTWYDTNLLANSNKQRFCEASVVNMGDYLLAYIRDNTGHKRYIWTSKSEDGITWSEAKPLYPAVGQRPSALKYDDRHTIVAFRNTQMTKISVMVHDVEKDRIRVCHLDHDYRSNLYNMGYTGIAPVGKGNFLVAYYIQNDSPNPYIKVARIAKKKVPTKWLPNEVPKTESFFSLFK